MVLIVDDFLLYKLVIDPLVISPSMTIFRAIRDYALREMYPLEKIRDAVKENRMLYEFGEISKEEYEKENERLMPLLKMAVRVSEITAKTTIRQF
ncbi:MAG: protein gvpG [Nanoarchaeota archaeon]|nr:protein gvpG [Nanoarchaeota archaeon]